jgi:hypothetical protein
MLVGLSDFICPDGGPIDEAISRDAWLETVAEADAIGIAGLESLSVEQIREFFLSFVAHAIEALLYHEIGSRGFRIANDLTEIGDFDAQFRSYIGRAVRDSFASDLTGLSSMTGTDISTIVDRTCQEAWDLLEQLGSEA